MKLNISFYTHKKLKLKLKLKLRIKTKETILQNVYWMNSLSVFLFQEDKKHIPGCLENQYKKYVKEKVEKVTDTIT